jgi:hypothetical protein
MSTLKLMLRDNRAAFQPGEAIEGGAFWQLDAPAKAVEVRLFWYTRGKGTEDVSVVERVRFENPQPQESRKFQFTLPASPWSFSGKLISLLWAIELVAEPSKESERLDIVVSPTQQEILLHKSR